MNIQPTNKSLTANNFN